MIDPREIREHVVRPALKHIGLWSDIAEELVMMTGMIESNYSHIVQVRGPARGLWQMEPRTHDDIWINYIAHQNHLENRLFELIPAFPSLPSSDHLVTNLMYAAAMCRIHYWRIPVALPEPKVAELAWYWKTYYNTMLGKGKVREFRDRGKRMWMLEQISYNKQADWKSDRNNFGSQTRDA